MKNIAFIINPISGSKETQSAKRKLPKLIMQTLDAEQWLPNIVFTERAGHATELAYQFARMGFDAVVAVGGDGTVNEVARGLVSASQFMVHGSSSEYPHPSAESTGDDKPLGAYQRGLRFGERKTIRQHVRYWF